MLADEHQLKLFEKLEEALSIQRETTTTDSDQTAPVNLLVFSGGGMKGVAHIGMATGFLDLNDGDDVLPYFDLVCGTSIGGIGSLLLNYTGSARECTGECYSLVDECRETTFRKLNWFDLALKGRCEPYASVNPANIRAS